MITITPTALQQLKLILVSELGEIEAIRFAIKGGGCVGFEFEMSIVNNPGELKPNDKKHDFSGVPVVIDPISKLYMDDATLDWKSDLMQHGFSFNIPGSRHCGCGRSFTAN